MKIFTFGCLSNTPSSYYLLFIYLLLELTSVVTSESGKPSDKTPRNGASEETPRPNSNATVNSTPQCVCQPIPAQASNPSMGGGLLYADYGNLDGANLDVVHYENFFTNEIFEEQQLVLNSFKFYSKFLNIFVAVGYKRDSKRLQAF